MASRPPPFFAVQAWLAVSLLSALCGSWSLVWLIVDLIMAGGGWLTAFYVIAGSAALFVEANARLVDIGRDYRESAQPQPDDGSSP